MEYLPNRNRPSRTQILLNETGQDQYFKIRTGTRPVQLEPNLNCKRTGPDWTKLRQTSEGQILLNNPIIDGKTW